MAKEIENTEATKVEEVKSIEKYSMIEAGLAKLKERHLNVVIDVTTPEGMKAAKEGRAELKRVRLDLEDARVEEKAESLAYGKRVDSEANRIKAVIVPMEDAYDNAIKAEEKRVKEIELEKVRALARIEEAKAKAIKDEEDRVAAEEKKKFEEAQEKLRLQEIEFERKQKEAADAQAKADAEIKAAQDKIEQEERERKAKIEAEEKASRDRIEAAERESRLKIEKEQAELARISREANEKIEAEAKAKRDAEQKAENERLAKIEAEKVKKQRAIDEKKRQDELKKQLRLDGITMLEVFVKKYGNQEEFETVSADIQKFLSVNQG